MGKLNRERRVLFICILQEPREFKGPVNLGKEKSKVRLGEDSALEIVNSELWVSWISPTSPFLLQERKAGEKEGDFFSNPSKEVHILVELPLFCWWTQDMGHEEPWIPLNPVISKQKKKKKILEVQNPYLSYFSWNRCAGDAGITQLST